MESMSRRSFVGAAAIAAAATSAMGAVSALAKEKDAAMSGAASSADASAAADQQLQLVAAAPEETEEQLKAKAELAHAIATAEPAVVNPDPVTGISQGRLGVTTTDFGSPRFGRDQPGASGRHA